MSNKLPLIVLVASAFGSLAAAATYTVDFTHQSFKVTPNKNGTFTSLVNFTVSDNNPNYGKPPPGFGPDPFINATLTNKTSCSTGPPAFSRLFSADGYQWITFDFYPSYDSFGSITQFTLHGTHAAGYTVTEIIGADKINKTQNPKAGEPCWSLTPRKFSAPEQY